MWLVGLAPAVFLPGALNRFVFLKLAVVAAAWACALMGARPVRLQRRVLVVLGLGAAVLAVSAALGSAPLAQLIGRAPRYEGAVSLSVYVGALLMGAWLLGSGADPRLRRQLLRATAVAASLMAIVALADLLGVHLLETSVARPGSLLGNATEQGAYGAGVFGLGVVLYAAGERSRENLLTLGAGAALVVLSASRGALLGLVVALAVALVLGSSRSRRAAVVAGAVASVAALSLPLTRQRLLMQSPLSQQTISGRAQEWAESLALVRERLLIGWGPSGFVDAWPSVQSADYVRLAGLARLDSPHSLVLQAALSGGLLLSVLAVALVVLVVRSVRRLRREPGEATWALASLAAVAGWSTVLLTHFTAPGSTPFFCVLAGALLSERRPLPVPSAQPAPPARLMRWAGPALAGGLALVLLLAAAAEVPLRKGLGELQAGDGQGAEASFTVAHALRPWDADLDAQIAHALVAQPSQLPSTRVDAYLQRASSHLPGDPSVLTDRALRAQQLGELSQARADLDAAHRLSPNDPVVLLARGRVRARAGDLQGAVGDLEASARLMPRNPVPLQTLAGLYAQSGQSDLAAQTLARAQTLGG